MLSVDSKCSLFSLVRAGYTLSEAARKIGMSRRTAAYLVDKVTEEASRLEAETASRLRQPISPPLKPVRMLHRLLALGLEPAVLAGLSIKGH